MYRMVHEFESEEKTVAFNMGLATLERINNLLISLSTHNIDGNIRGMRNSILEIYKEAFVYMKEDEEKDAEDRWLEIEKYAISSVDSTSVRFNPDLILLLNDFDFWIRKLLHKKGILMPKGDDPRNVMTRTKGY